VGVRRSAPGVDPEIDSEENVITPEDIRDLTPDKVIVTFSHDALRNERQEPPEFCQILSENPAQWYVRFTAFKAF
jgi:hypothetical protein